MNPIENAEEIVDFSVSQDGTVLGYYVKDNLESESSTYTLYIQAEGKIKINPIASYFATYQEVYGLENVDTSEVVDMSSMFLNMKSMTDLDVSNFDTSNVTDMSNMFSRLSNLTSLDISHFDTRNVTNMMWMFNGMRSLTSLDLSNFDTTNVTNMRHMFNGMYSLTNLNLSSFDTSNATDMQSMFQYNRNLTNIVYGNNFIKNSELNINYMYYQCPANKPTHSSWDGVSW